MIDAENLFLLPSTSLSYALARLHALFRLGGFRVHRPHHNEATLRAYIGKESRPLANPRLSRRVRAGRRTWPGTCLVVFVSPGERYESVELGTFASDAACALHSYRREDDESVTELAFVLPIKVSEAGAFSPEVESAIVSGLRRIGAYLAPLVAP